MNHSSKQFRLSIAAVLATFFVISVYALNSNPSSSSSNSSRSTDEGVIAQVEGIFATSARHVFDEGYWIANMHSIRSSLY
jgi:hypothetical protein